MLNLQSLESGNLVEHLITCSTERGCLIADGATDEELSSAQKKVDLAHLEVMRRMAW
jgi:hypothetical protein